MSDELVPPHDLEAEKAVLGAMMVNNQIADLVADVITAEDFYRQAHATIYRHAELLHKRGTAIDLITLRDSLQAAGELDAVSGPAYISSLADGVPRSTNAAHYAGIVREKAIRRLLQAAGREIASEAVVGSGDAAESLQRAQGLVWGISTHRHVGGGLLPAKQLVSAAFDALEHAGTRGVATGLADLDAVVRLKPGVLCLVAGRPAMGKTSLAMNIATNAAKRSHRVAVFSLEMAKEELTLRIVSGETSINAQRLMDGEIREHEWAKVTQSLGTIEGWPLHVDDTAGVTVASVRSKCRRLQASGGLDLVVIDYVQLMTEPGKFANRNLEVAAISRGLKLMAKELGVPFIVICQLNRASEQRASHRPELSDLRDSGALEQDADLVLMVHREEEYCPTPQNQGLADVLVKKQRNGPTGAVTLRFFKEFTRFSNLARD